MQRGEMIHQGAIIKRHPRGIHLIRAMNERRNDQNLVATRNRGTEVPWLFYFHRADLSTVFSFRVFRGKTIFHRLRDVEF